MPDQVTKSTSIASINSSQFPNVHLLKRAHGQDEYLSEHAVLLWDLVFNPQKSRDFSERSVDDYVDAVLSILAQTSSVEVIFHWARQDGHHVCQWLEVIVKLASRLTEMKATIIRSSFKPLNVTKKLGNNRNSFPLPIKSMSKLKPPWARSSPSGHVNSSHWNW